MTRASVGTVLMLFACGGAYAQTADAQLTFEVASIKPSPPSDGRGMRVGTNGGPGTSDPGRYTTENLSLSNLVTQAYNLKRYEYSGPSWMDTERFDVVAKVPAGATKEQFRVMLQNLLAERFKLTFHREQKEMQIYELVVAKNGPKMKEAVEEPVAIDTTKGGPREGGASVGSSVPPPPPPGGRDGGMPRFTMGKDGFPILPAGSGPMTIMMNGRARTQGQQTMEQFAAMLSGQVSRPVKDATGLKGKYEIRLAWAAESMGGRGMPPPPPNSEGAAPLANAADDSGPTIYAAIQEQLGLKLEQKKGQIDILVVDHAEKVPSEN